MKVGQKLPEVVFHTRVRDESIAGPNPFRWEEKTTSDYFAGKRAILFALPGAFTPTCSTYQLPGFEDNFAAFQALGIDTIYVLSVNDSFVMNKWAEAQGIKNIKVIPDGIFDTDGLRRDSRVHINIIATHQLRGSLIPMSPRHRPRFASEHSVTFSMSDGLQLTGCSHGAVFNSVLTHPLRVHYVRCPSDIW